MRWTVASWMVGRETLAELVLKLKEKNLSGTILWHGDNGSQLDKVWGVSASIIRCSWLSRMGEQQAMHKMKETCTFQVRK